MESSWTRVRQLAAKRVLDRHLQDLQDQSLAVQRTHKQHVHHLEHEMRVQRSRAGSLQVSASDPIFPSPRRHSLPPAVASQSGPLVRERLATLQDRDYDDDDDDDDDDMDRLPTTLSTYDTTPGGQDGDDTDTSILDMMTNTLHAAQSMEQQRPSLYLLDRSRQSRGKPLPGSSRVSMTRAVPKAKPSYVDTRPVLERGETLLRMNQSQVLSLNTDDADRPPSRKSARDSTMAATTSAAVLSSRGQPSGLPADTSSRRNSNAKRRGSREPLGLGARDETISVDALRHVVAAPKPRGVKVEFYDEGAAPKDKSLAIEKEDDGFSPASMSLTLTLPLHEMDGDDDGGGGEEEEDVSLTEETEEFGENPGWDEAWDQAKRCRYIRGYDPPNMLLPKDTVQFVFGDT